MNLRTFAERAIRLRNAPFSLTARPYLDAVYRSRATNIVIRASRQVEKSTFIVNRILCDAVQKPGVQILFVCPRREQARQFSYKRLNASVRGSASLGRLLWPYRRPMPMEDIPFANGSHVFIRAAFHSADAIRGISADELFVDEYQDLAPGELPVLKETLSHSHGARTVLTGTPKMIDNHLEAAFGESTACEWQVPCRACGQSAILDERVLGPTSLVCPSCRGPLDSRQGEWVARNPHSGWGDGFWINHLMAPWMQVHEILDRQRDYDPVRFRNEVLGLPTTLGDHVITRDEIEACCEDRPFAQAIADIPARARPALVAGIDWGGGAASGTVLVLGYIQADHIFRLVRFERWAPHADPTSVVGELARLCRQFRVQWIAADGNGNGHVYNRLLLDRLRSGESVPGLYALYYSGADQAPIRDGALMKWTVHRTASIATLFGRIKNRLVRFPRLVDSTSFLDEFTCEYVIYDAEMRSVKYTKPETLKDDSLHATNYAQLLALRMLYATVG